MLPFPLDLVAACGSVHLLAGWTMLLEILWGLFADCWWLWRNGWWETLFGNRDWPPLFKIGVSSIVNMDIVDLWWRTFICCNSTWLCQPLGFLPWQLSDQIINDDAGLLVVVWDREVGGIPIEYKDTVDPFIPHGSHFPSLSIGSGRRRTRLFVALEVEEAPCVSSICWLGASHWLRVLLDPAEDV